MTIEQALQWMGGVARTSALLERGFSERDLDRGIRGGTLIRVRRGVLALPDAPRDFVQATAAGARLACLSAATHYDLWCVRPATGLHVSRSVRSAKGCINHRGLTVPPHPRLPIVGLVDVLVHVLQCRPDEESVPLVESALRRRAPCPPSSKRACPAPGTAGHGQHRRPQS